MKYKVLEHKADLKIRVFGQDKKELFSNALLAMSKNMKAEMEKEKVKREIKIKSNDLSALLVDFLSEALYLSQTNQEVYFNVIFKKFTDIEIEGEIIGQKVERFGQDIKAVTYHDLEVKQQEGAWQADLLFDI